MNIDNPTQAETEEKPDILGPLHLRLAAVCRHYMEEGGVKENDVPVRPIFHYTTAIGLNGILTDKRIYATNTDYLNDDSEILYGRYLLADAIAAKIANLKKVVIPDDKAFINSNVFEYLAEVPLNKLAPWIFLHSLQQDIETFKEADYYVTCFCEEPDLLSQWRGYTTQCGGYSIGVQFSTANIQISPTESFGLYKILYNREAQERMVEGLLDAILEEIQDNLGKMVGLQIPGNANPFLGGIRQSANHLLRLMTLRFKPKGYSEEREWRCFAAKPIKSVGDLKFRDSKGILIPYVELPLLVSEIALKSVHLGPSLRADLAGQSINLLLAQLGFTGIPVFCSNIPFKA